MTKKAADLDPMNGIRKAAKNGDWTSLMVEYMANKSGLGALIGDKSPNEGSNNAETTAETTIPKPIKGMYKQ